MKSDYRIRAFNFLAQIFPYIYDCLECPSKVEDRVNDFNSDHSRKVHCDYGSARVALITSDYVIKWDYNTENVKDIGGCDDEIRIYKNACSRGYGYLLAESTDVTYHGYRFNIMPRIANVTNYRKKDISAYLTTEEYLWLTEFCHDLHRYNWGIRHGRACVIDYAFDETVAERGEWS